MAMLGQFLIWPERRSDGASFEDNEKEQIIIINLPHSRVYATLLLFTFSVEVSS